MGSFEKQWRYKVGGKGISKKSVRIILFCSLVNCVLVCHLFFFPRKSCPGLSVLPSESQIMARYDLVNPETRARYRDMPKKKPGLLTLSVGKSEGPNVDVGFRNITEESRVVLGARFSEAVKRKIGFCEQTKFTCLCER